MNFHRKSDFAEGSRKMRAIYAQFYGAEVNQGKQLTGPLDIREWARIFEVHEDVSEAMKQVRGHC